MRAIDKMVEKLEQELASHEFSYGRELTRHHLEKARRLAAEEKSGDEAPTPKEAPEPKDCGFTLATCPYERCSGITMRDPRATEPLAVLADRKNCYFTVVCHKGEWDIQIYSHEDESDVPIEFCDGVKTYPEAEAKARAFLMGLPDREGN